MQYKTIERISSLERAYIDEVLYNQFQTSAGSIMSTRLEEAFCAAYPPRFAIAHANGTCTMHTALAAAGIGDGDEVIVPPLTMASTTFAVIHAGAEPVFADIDSDTLQLCADSVLECITPRTKAIIVVALYGLPADLIRLRNIADDHGLLLVEDNAQAVDASIDSRPIGTFGHMASYSFQSSKHLAAGEGGILLVEDEAQGTLARRFSSLGYASLTASGGTIARSSLQGPDTVRHSIVGFNYRMPELCAAVVLAQFERRGELIQRRREVAELFTQVTSGHPWLRPQLVPFGYVNTYWSWVVQIQQDDITWQQFNDCFEENGGDKIYAAWRLTYQEPFFHSLGQRRFPSCPVAERIQPRIIQFKTNYWNWDEALRQSEALSATVNSLCP